jgi:hypothetical protein
LLPPEMNRDRKLMLKTVETRHVQTVETAQSGFKN